MNTKAHLDCCVLMVLVDGEAKLSYQRITCIVLYVLRGRGKKEEEDGEKMINKNNKANEESKVEVERK